MHTLNPQRVPAGGRRRGARLAVLAAAAAIALTSSPALGPAVARADEDLTLRMGTIWEQTTSAPTQCCLDVAAFMLTYDKLAAYPFGGGEPAPQYAESWTISPDGLTWTFKIRDGMQWSDGEPADATDAAFTFNYIADTIGTDNEIGNGFVSSWGLLDADGKSILASAEAPDPTTLIVTTTVPAPGLLMANYAVLPEHIWKDVTPSEANTSFQTEPPVVGSGPFVLAEWKHGQYLRLTRNEHYWGPQSPIKDILIVTYKTQDAQIQALQAGELDLVLDANIAQFDALQGVDNVEAISARTSTVTQLFFNTLGTGGGAVSDALADPSFRSAIDYAIDHQALVDKVYAGHAQPGLGLVAPSDPDFTGMTDIARTFDIETAKAKLDEAGYPMGPDGVRVDKDGKPLDLRLLTSNGMPSEIQTTAQFIVQWLGQVGIKATPVSTDMGAYWDTMVTSRKWDLAVGWTTGSGGPGQFNLPLTFETGCYDCWHPQEWKDLYAQYASTVDPAEARVIGDQLNRLHYSQAPFITLVYPDLIQAHRTDTFSNWVRQPADSGPYASLDLTSAIFPFFTQLQAPGAPTPSEEAPSASEAASAAPSEAASAAPSPSGEGSVAGSSDSTTLIIGIIAVVVVIGGGLILVRRRRTA